MLIREIILNEKDRYNSVVKHAVQSWEWGDAKEETGNKAFRYGLFDNMSLVDGFQVTLHKLPAPLNNFTIAHLGKCTLPSLDMLYSLKEFGKKNSCIFIKIEPNIYGPVADPEIQKYLKETRQSIFNTKELTIVPGKEMFPRYNFLLDITPTEEDLLSKMHEKTRYNIGLAQRKGVKVVEMSNEEGFKIYLKIYFETVKRQGYYGHDVHYHRAIWETLKAQNMAHILIAYYQDTPITAWMLINFNGTLYYPYGGSRSQFRNVMASNLVAWEAILLGKRLNLAVFDMWGAMGPEPDTNDPWYGFHKFKSGYGPQHVESLGTFDLIVNPPMYQVFNKLDAWRTKWLKLTAKFR